MNHIIDRRNKIAANIAGQFSDNAPKRPQPDNSLMKGVIMDTLGYGYGNGSEPLKFTKTGKELKSQLPAVVANLNTKKAEVMAQMNLLCEEIGTKPSQPCYNDSTLMEYPSADCYSKYDEMNRCYPETTDTMKNCQKYNGFVYSLKSINDDIKAINVIMANVKDTATYPLTISQLVALCWDGMEKSVKEDTLEKGVGAISKKKDLTKCDYGHMLKGADDKQQAKVHKVMGEFKDGKLKSSNGELVTDRKQAIAIAMSEAGLSKDMYGDEGGSDISESIEKSASGEGSKGGHIIGHTKSGKPVYETGFHKEVVDHFKKKRMGGVLNHAGIKHEIEHNDDGSVTVKMKHKGDESSEKSDPNPYKKKTFDNDHHAVAVVASGVRENSGHMHNHKISEEVNNTTENEENTSSGKKSHVGKITTETTGKDGDYETRMTFHPKEKKDEIHHVDWDGPSRVKATEEEGGKVGLHRVDKEGKEREGDEHHIIVTKKQFEKMKNKNMEKSVSVEEHFHSSRANIHEIRRNNILNQFSDSPSNSVTNLTTLQKGLDETMTRDFAAEKQAEHEQELFKSFLHDVTTEYQLADLQQAKIVEVYTPKTIDAFDNIIKGLRGDELEKAARDRSKLVQKKIVGKDGVSRTMWVKPGEKVGTKELSANGIIQSKKNLTKEDIEKIKPHVDKLSHINKIKFHKEHERLHGKKYEPGEGDSGKQSKTHTTKAKVNGVDTTLEEVSGEDHTKVLDYVKIPSDLTKDPMNKQGQTGRVTHIDKYGTVTVKFADGTSGSYQDGVVEKSKKEDMKGGKEYKKGEPISVDKGDEEDDVYDYPNSDYTYHKKGSVLGHHVLKDENGDFHTVKESHMKREGDEGENKFNEKEQKIANLLNEHGEEKFYDVVSKYYEPDDDGESEHEMVKKLAKHKDYDKIVDELDPVDSGSHNKKKEKITVDSQGHRKDESLTSVGKEADERIKTGFKKLKEKETADHPNILTVTHLTMKYGMNSRTAQAFIQNYGNSTKNLTPERLKIRVRDFQNKVKNAGGIDGWEKQNS